MAHNKHTLMIKGEVKDVFNACSIIIDVNFYIVSINHIDVLNLTVELERFDYPSNEIKNKHKELDAELEEIYDQHYGFSYGRK